MRDVLLAWSLALAPYLSIEAIADIHHLLMVHSSVSDVLGAREVLGARGVLGALAVDLLQCNMHLNQEDKPSLD